MTIDSYGGSVADNAGGITEMADMRLETQKITESLAKIAVNSRLVWAEISGGMCYHQKQGQGLSAFAWGGTCVI